MKTLLLIDDDASFRQRLGSILGMVGFDVLTAESAAEGLELAASHAIDAALTDFYMPHGDGLEFCRALQEQSKATGRHVPVWIMTASADLELPDARAAGAVGVFRKPFHVLEICNRIELHLQSVAEQSVAAHATGN